MQTLTLNLPQLAVPKIKRIRHRLKISCQKKGGV